MNEETMKKLFEFNCNVPQSDNKLKIDGNGNPTCAGYCTRMMLHCLYVVSMLCLLHYDEALNL
jgi:hypothetical protein